MLQEESIPSKVMPRCCQPDVLKGVLPATIDPIIDLTDQSAAMNLSVPAVLPSKVCSLLSPVCVSHMSRASSGPPGG